MIVNILVVYFLSGLWHGAGWNYVLWGMLHGILYVITRMVMLIWKKRSDITEISGTTETTDTSETTGTDHAGVHEDQSGSDPNVTQKKKISPASVAGTILTFAYVNLCWVFFRAPSVADAVALIRRLLSGSWTSVNATLSGAVTPDEIWYVIKALKFERIGYVFAKNAGMAVTTLIALLIVFAFPNAYAVSRKLKPKAVIAVLLGVLGMWCIISLSGVSTFLYFNF
jgi:alginate O-acetyltransferase complex protein AlgI